jgi:hypothetical protein
MLDQDLAAGVVTGREGCGLVFLQREVGEPVAAGLAFQQQATAPKVIEQDVGTHPGAVRARIARTACSARAAGMSCNWLRIMTRRVLGRCGLSGYR